MGMDDITPKCTQCSLLTSEKPGPHSAHKEAILFFIPGLFFSTLAIRWSVVLICKWRLLARTQALEIAGLPPPPLPGKGRVTRLPGEGLVKVVLAVLAAGFQSL